MRDPRLGEETKQGEPVVQEEIFEVLVAAFEKEIEWEGVLVVAGVGCPVTAKKKQKEEGE